MAQRCPACGSADRIWAGGSPPFGNDIWQCDGCDTTWAAPPRKAGVLAALAVIALALALLVLVPA